MRRITIVSSAREMKTLFSRLHADDDELLPLSGAKEFGFGYWQLHRLIEGGKLDCFNIYGNRYVKRSDLEALEPPKRGRPPKKLSPTDCGHLI